MMIRRSWLCAGGFAVAYLFIAGCAVADRPGVQFTYLERPGPQQIYVLRVPRDDPHIRLMVGWPDGQRGYTARATTSAIAAHYDAQPGLEVLGAVNASFFGPVPVVVGTTISAGEPLQMPAGKYDTVVMSPDGTPRIVEDMTPWPGALQLAGGASVPITCYNQLPPPDGVTAFTPTWGAVVVDPNIALVTTAVLTQVQPAPQLGHAFDAEVTALATGAAARNQTVPADGLVLVGTGVEAERLQKALTVGAAVHGVLGFATPPVEDVDFAVTGIGWLVHDGVPYTQNWPQHKFATQRHPRTVLAWDAHDWWLVVVAGRCEEGVGMDFAELAHFLITDLHVAEALNLDGGGSSTMVVDGTLRNAPSDGHERPVGNAVLVVRRP